MQSLCLSGDAGQRQHKSSLPTHSLNWYEDRLSSKLLEMDATSTTSDDQFKGKTGKLLEWQLSFLFPC